MKNSMILRVLLVTALASISECFLSPNNKFVAATRRHNQPPAAAALMGTRRMDVGKSENTNNFGKDLVNHELLTANDEFQLSRQYKLGLQVKEQRKIMSTKLGREITDTELAKALGLSSVDHVDILINRGRESKRALIKANMRLVFHICKYYRYRGVAYPDLVQEGTFGLIKAVDKFDPEKGFRFSTYSSWWIKQAVSRALADKSRLIRLPVHIHDLMVSFGRAEATFLAQNSRRPSPEELAERLALPLPKVELLVKCSKDVSTIDTDLYNGAARGGGISGNNEVQVKDRLVSQTAQPTSLNDKINVRSELRRAMGDLTSREAQIVEMRFGLSDGTQMTLEEIGKHFRVTRERIRQIEARALSKMRSPTKALEIKEIFQDHSFVLQQHALWGSSELRGEVEKKKTNVMESI